MRRTSSSPLAFPDFRGATRRLVLVNLAAFFALLVAGLAFPATTGRAAGALTFVPSVFLHGAVWQPLTYSLVHPGLLGTLLELLSLWFLVGFLESYRGDSWVTGLYATSVLGTAAGACALYGAGLAVGHPFDQVALYGCFGGIFGLLVTIGVLYGDVEFMLFPLPISIKARYLAIIYGLVAIAMLFSQQGPYAFAQLAGALCGWFYTRVSPRRGLSFAFSERWYGIRNRYYRWKRRRAARKFEVYMRSQGKTVRLDGQGRQIGEDQEDKSRWN